jgi:hypothetical protein
MRSRNREVALTARMSAQNTAPVVQRACPPAHPANPIPDSRLAARQNRGVAASRVPRNPKGAFPLRSASLSLRPSQVPAGLTPKDELRASGPAEPGANPFGAAAETSQIEAQPEPPPAQHEAIRSPVTLGLLSHIQPKLTVGSVNDPLEDAADRVADQVMHIAEPQIAVVSPRISRKSSSGGEKEEAHQLRARREASGAAADDAPAVVTALLGSPGRPLEADTRAFMESRLGCDLSNVRIHTGPLASRSAEAVAARAYTVDRNVVFRHGEYAPDTTEGRRLLAHELAHVVQQRPTQPPPKTLRPSQVTAVGSHVQRQDDAQQPDTSSVEDKTGYQDATTRSGQPGSPTHELTHVVQQRTSQPMLRPQPPVVASASRPATAAGGSQLLGRHAAAPSRLGSAPHGVVLRRAPAEATSATATSLSEPAKPDSFTATSPRVAFVREEGLNLRVGPDQAATAVARMPFGSRVHVLEDESLHPGWLKVATSASGIGFLHAKEVHFPPPNLIEQDPGLTMVRIRSGQTFWGLVKEQYGIQGNESTADQNIDHFINAIRAVNKSEAFVVKTDWLDDAGNWLISGRDASDTLLKAGYDLWIPSFGFAAQMDVGSGTVTGEVARFVKRIEQLLKDFKDAAAAAGKYIPAAVAHHAGQAALGLLTGLVDFAVDAAKILGVSTAVGALIGSLFGGVGALPGAEIGFEIGLLILEIYGLVMLVETILSIAGNLLGQLASFIGQVWNAKGDPKKIDQAGQTLADTLGVLVSAVLIAVAAYLMKKGGEALSGTKFAETVGRSRLARWLAERQRGTTTREALEPSRSSAGAGPAKLASPQRSRGASASGVRDEFNVETHPAGREPVVETRRPGPSRSPEPQPAAAGRSATSGPRRSSSEDIAAVHDELTEGTGRGQRSPSDPEELNAPPERRTVDEGDIAGEPREPYRPPGATPPPPPGAPPGVRRAWLHERLRQHVQAARERFEVEGYTPNQEIEIRTDPRAAARHRGSRIDGFAKDSVMNDPDLAAVITAPDRVPEPDFIDSSLRTAGDDWFDATTVGSWREHLRRYADRYGRGGLVDTGHLSGPPTPTGQPNL